MKQVTLRGIAPLRDAGLIASTGDGLAALERVAALYAVAITPAMAALVDPRDFADPIARQFVPDARELIRDPAKSFARLTDSADNGLFAQISAGHHQRIVGRVFEQQIMQRRVGQHHANSRIPR